MNDANERPTRFVTRFKTDWYKYKLDAGISFLKKPLSNFRLCNFGDKDEKVKKHNLCCLVNRRRIAGSFNQSANYLGGLN